MSEHNITEFHGHDSGLEHILGVLPEDENCVKMAELFSLLSDSTRLRILFMLCHCEECVSDIATAVNMSSPAVSHHLKMLRSAGLISSKRDGKEMLYTLSDSEEARLVHAMIDRVFSMECYDK